MTDASSSAEGYVALFGGVITTVGLLLAWLQGDKEGAKKRTATTVESVGMSVANQESYRSIIGALETIIERLDRVVEAIRDKKTEELAKHVSEDFRHQSMSLLEELKDKIDANEHRRSEAARDAGRR